MVFPQQEATPPPASPPASLGARVRLETKAEQLGLDGEGKRPPSPEAPGDLGAGSRPRSSLTALQLPHSRKVRLF